MNPSRRLRGSRTALAVAFLPVVLSAADVPVEEVGRIAHDWVKTRAETVRLEDDWASQKGILASLVSALDERARLLEEKGEALKAQTERERGELDALEGRNEASAAALGAAEKRLRALGDVLVQLRPSLPPRLSAALELPYRSIADATMPPGDRMQHTMTILNRCVQFNRLVSLGEEVVTVGGGEPARSLEVIYWGLSHAYALDRAAGRVWLGSPAALGWQWQEQAGAAEPVARLIAVAADKADPDFILAPAKLGTAKPATP